MIMVGSAVSTDPALLKFDPDFAGRWKEPPVLDKGECEWPGCSGTPTHRDHRIPLAFAKTQPLKNIIADPEKNLLQICRFHNYVKHDSLLLGILLIMVRR
jgi:hypothetical protein